MQHLLITRFQGAFIGARTIYHTAQQIAPNQLTIATTPVLTGGITSLVRCGRFDSQDWLQSTMLAANRPQHSIVAMLPLMLFFHDDATKLRAALVTASHSWQLDWETCSSAVVLGYIISRSLTETLIPSTVIARLLAETSNLHPSICQELSTIDRCLAESSSLRQVTRQLTATPHPIVTPTILASYCLLATPEDFSLAMLRARRTEYELPFTCALTGMLAGAHNSLAGIPINGTMTQERQQLLSAAAALLTSWAGVYRQPARSQSSAHPLTVAAPGALQRRN